MIEAFKAYFEQIKKLDVKDSTEHTLRPALDHLFFLVAQAFQPVQDAPCAPCIFAPLLCAFASLRETYLFEAL